MIAVPETYRWVSDSILAEAGCITVISTADAEKVRQSFGADDETHSTTPPTEDRFWTNEPTPSWAWFASPTDAAATVIEFNGFQGSRPEVLREASRASADGKAASAFWNVNGMVIVTCARRGKVVASIDLSLLDPSNEDAVRTLPRSLQRLGRTVSDEEAGLIAVAVAMVEQFTGVAVSASSLEAGTARVITPRACDLRTFTADDVPSHLADHPQLTKLLVALTPARQRLISQWATRIAVAEAGLDEEPAIAQVLSQFGDLGNVGQLAVPTLNPGVDALDGAITRRSDQISSEEMELGTYCTVEGYLTSQEAWAVSAVRQATNPDALSAALGCCDAAIVAASCAKLERPFVLVVDERGGRLVDADEPATRRAQAIADLLANLATSDLTTWENLVREAPSPLTAAERESAIATDRRRQAAGEFDEFKFSSD